MTKGGPIPDASLTFIDRAEIRRLLGYRDCIELIRDAMVALSSGNTRQMLRQITPVRGHDVLSAMAGVMPPEFGFGAKVISVYRDNAKRGRQSHQGVVVLFDTETGEPECVLHAGELTRIRTAAASALATDVLANADASRLAVLGYGEQGQSHIEAVASVRKLRSVRIWGRSHDEAVRVAKELTARLKLEVEPAASVAAAVRDADIICTTTAATDPVLLGRWVEAHAHVNVVGSSEGSSAEVDNELIGRARVFADHREGVLKQGGEILRAIDAGVIDAAHVLGEIGDVIMGTLPGRTARDQVTLYKSLGHIVQDLAAARYLYERQRGQSTMRKAY